MCVGGSCGGDSKALQENLKTIEVFCARRLADQPTEDWGGRDRNGLSQKSKPRLGVRPPLLLRARGASRIGVPGPTFKPAQPPDLEPRRRGWERAVRSHLPPPPMPLACPRAPSQLCPRRARVPVGLAEPSLKIAVPGRLRGDGQGLSRPRAYTAPPPQPPVVRRDSTSRPGARGEPWLQDAPEAPSLGSRRGREPREPRVRAQLCAGSPGASRVPLRVCV